MYIMTYSRHGDISFRVFSILTHKKRKSNHHLLLLVIFHDMKNTGIKNSGI